jgi:hypothetical protein
MGVPSTDNGFLPMNTHDVAATFAARFSELVDGPTKSEAYILNTGDVGLLGSLEKLPARAASAASQGGATIAAHVDHVRYGISLMNRWAAGETDPWRDADWSLAWRITSVSEDEWTALRAALRDEIQRWRASLRKPRDVSDSELNNMIASIAHLAYHLGAIRQIDKGARGPRESG